MNETNYKRIFAIVTACVGLCFLTFFLCLIFQKTLYSPTADHYFMIPHSHLLIDKGFVLSEPLRLHKNFDFVIPQWLFAYIFERCIHFLSLNGFKIFLILQISFYMIASYLVLHTIRPNSYKAVILVFLINLLNMCMFPVSRPFFSSVSIGLIEIYFFENKNKFSPLYFYLSLFLLSVLLINLHNSLWILLILIELCYFGESVLYSIKKRKFNKKEYMQHGMILVSIFLGGLLNPYGIRYITYIFNSLESVKSIEVLIPEIWPIYKRSIFGFGILILYLFYYLKNFNKIPLRFWFLFVGFGFMTLCHYRNLMIFLSFATIGIYSILQKDKDSEKTIRLFSVLFLIIPLSVVLISPHAIGKNDSSYKAVDIIVSQETRPLDELTFFANSLDLGSYALLKGMHPYMDTCAEIYQYENNHHKDIGLEFIQSFENMDEFTKLYNNYQFDYMVLTIDSDHSLSIQPIYTCIDYFHHGNHVTYIYKLKKGNIL